MVSDVEWWDWAEEWGGENACDFSSELNEAVGRAIDFHVGKALQQAFDGIFLMLEYSSSDGVTIYAGNSDFDIGMTKPLALSKVFGWEGESSGHTASRKIANALEELAKRARMSADEWEASGGHDTD